MLNLSKSFSDSCENTISNQRDRKTKNILVYYYVGEQNYNDINIFN